MFYIMSCFVWTPERVAATFATANGDPLIKSLESLSRCIEAVLVDRGGSVTKKLYFGVSFVL